MPGPCRAGFGAGVMGQTLPECMALFRAKRGIGVRAAGKLAGVSWSTWARAERGDGGLLPANARRVEMVLRGADMSDADRIDELERALRQLRTWAEAYPIGVFPEPDFTKAAAVLKGNDMTLDAISASNMRHILTGVISILDGVLGKEKP